MVSTTKSIFPNIKVISILIITKVTLAQEEVMNNALHVVKNMSENLY